MAFRIEKNAGGSVFITPFEKFPINFIRGSGVLTLRKTNLELAPENTKMISSFFYNLIKIDGLTAV